MMGRNCDKKVSLRQRPPRALSPGLRVQPPLGRTTLPGIPSAQRAVGRAPPMASSNPNRRRTAFRLRRQDGGWAQPPSGSGTVRKDVGKGRSPTSPAEAAGPRRGLEVREVSRAQAGLRERRWPFMQLVSQGRGTERPLRAYSRSHTIGPIGAFGGPAAFWEV